MMRKRISIARSGIAMLLILSSFQAVCAERPIITADDCAGASRVTDKNVTVSGFLSVCSGGLTLFPAAKDSCYGGVMTLCDPHRFVPYGAALVSLVGQIVRMEPPKE